MLHAGVELADGGLGPNEQALVVGEIDAELGVFGGELGVGGFEGGDLLEKRDGGGDERELGCKFLVDGETWERGGALEKLKGGGGGIGFEVVKGAGAERLKGGGGFDGDGIVLVAGDAGRPCIDIDAVEAHEEEDGFNEEGGGGLLVVWCAEGDGNGGEIGIEEIVGRSGVGEEDIGIGFALVVVVAELETGGFVEREVDFDGGGAEMDEDGQERGQ